MLKSKVFEKFDELIDNPNDKVVIGVSGGSDSIALLHLYIQYLDDLKIDYSDKITVCHINHKLRGKESDSEAAFVESLAKYFGLDFVCVDWNNHEGNNIQEAARKFRYQTFASIALANNSHYVLTAHHQDDLIASILMNLDRGGDTGAYIGIREIVNEVYFDIIRPLLYVEKQELKDYLKSNGYNHIEDSSNSLIKYKRNDIRLNKIPQLEKDDPDFRKKILLRHHESLYINTINQSRVDHLLSQGTGYILKCDDEWIIKRTIIKANSKDGLFFFIRELLSKFTNSKDYYPVRKKCFNQLYELISTDKNGIVNFPKNIKIRLNKNSIIISK